MAITRVERVALDGTTVTVTFGKVPAACKKASYGDGLETDTLVNMGEQKIAARTLGTYKTEQLKITMDAAEFRANFGDALDASGFGNRKINGIVVTYGSPDLGFDSDMMKPCRFVSLTTSAENSNKAIEVEMTFDVDQVYWTNARKTINQPDMTKALGASKF